mmetsp:Transcript_24909/g.72953  ORF Transcript_24909/g.72953 Transcript_24909/m.72953 type:complete len:99 (+) Transcript_24909:1203-1499(+)
MPVSGDCCLLFNGISSILGFKCPDNNRVPWKLGKKEAGSEEGADLDQSLRLRLEAKLAAGVWDPAPCSSNVAVSKGTGILPPPNSGRERSKTSKRRTY